jgi:tetratricopeptide (TPR) repeat protein
MKKIITSLILIGALAISSCKSLEVTPPNSIYDSQISELIATGDEETVSKVLTAIGGNLPAYFNYYSSSYTGYSAVALNSQYDQEFIRSMLGNDALIGTTATATTSGHYVYYQLESKNWRDGTTNQNSAYWNMPADFITAANKVMKYVNEDVIAKNPAVAGTLAEALVVRAWGYLLLAERYAPAYSLNPGARGVPIYTEYRVNPVVAPSSLAEVYNKVISWLNRAIELFDAINTGYTAELGDIDKGVAQYLLMRAALEFGDYATVISAGEDIVAAYPTLIPVEKYGAKNADIDAYAAKTKELYAKDNAFTSADANPEAILAFKKGALYNRADAYSYCNAFAASVGRDFPRIDNRLYEMIAPNDVRKNIFTDHAIDYTFVTNVDENITNTITIPPYTTLKWGATICLDETERTQRTYSDDIIIRASEVYLMLAEAYAQSNRGTDAENTLNKILAARSTSGTLTCSNYPSMSGMSALEKVKLQTRIEMWLEKGLEFNNNKRWGIAVDRTGSANHFSAVKTLSLDEMNIEIPVDELYTNPNWK